jgi:hypothetical protein
MWFINLQVTVRLLNYNAVSDFYIMTDGFCQENSAVSLILQEKILFNDETPSEFIFMVKNHPVRLPALFIKRPGMKIHMGLNLLCQAVALLFRAFGAKTHKFQSMSGDGISGV